MFQIITNAYKLFEVSKIEQKRRLINFVFLNIKLNGKKLEYTLQKPFNLIVDLDNHPSWRKAVDEFRNEFQRISLNNWDRFLINFVSDGMEGLRLVA